MANLPEWLTSDDFRPYVYVRKENRSYHPGTVHHYVDWFTDLEPLVKNPMAMNEVSFANMISNMETKAFGSSAMPMPRWVFYDCAIIPGIVTGFAMRTSKMPKKLIEVLGQDESLEWTPISLFIAIPTVTPGEWVAHNLCSINSLLPKSENLYGLGFLTKAYGLWYANISNLCGVTQWTSPAIKLHCNYGNFEILTSFTPVHSYSATVTYRSWVDSSVWHTFFDKKADSSFKKYFEAMNFVLHTTDESSLKSLQLKLEQSEGPFYLDAQEIRSKGLGEHLTVYRPK